jgi:hypothetical protein
MFNVRGIIRPHRTPNKRTSCLRQKFALNPVERAAHLLYGKRSKFLREQIAAPDAGDGDSA